MKKILVLLFVAVFISYLNNDYIEIPSTSIRIRVIANSDSDIDQSSKQTIKSELEGNIYDLIKDASSIEEVDDIINSNISTIDSGIQKSIEENNIKTTFTTNYGYNYFPQKDFKGITYKSGLYKSYVVTLGEGNGENWWCVLYPPICLVDENKSDYEYHSLIKDIIDIYN